MNILNSNQPVQSPPSQSKDLAPEKLPNQKSLGVQKTMFPDFKESAQEKMLDKDNRIRNDRLRPNDWKRYYGTVIGSKKEVQEALKLLGRRPVDSGELRQYIYNWRRLDLRDLYAEYA